MIDFLIYDLKVAVLIAVFYMFFVCAAPVRHHDAPDGGDADAYDRRGTGFCRYRRHPTAKASVADIAACLIYNRYGSHARQHPLVDGQNHQPD